MPVAGKLGAEELNWVESALRLGLRAPVADGAALVASCPAGFRASPDFGYFAGIYTGRCIEIDRKAEGAIAEPVLNNLYSAIGSFTVFDPSLLVYALGSLVPSALLPLFAGWPQAILALRPFYIGVFFGLYLEKAEYTEVADEKVRDSLFRTLAMHRRPGNGPSVI